MSEKLTLISFRIPPSIHDELRRKALKESRPVAAVIRDLLENGLDDLTIRNMYRQQQQMNLRLKSLEQAALENNSAVHELKEPVDSLHQMFRHLLETLTENSQRRLP